MAKSKQDVKTEVTYTQADVDMMLQAVKDEAKEKYTEEQVQQLVDQKVYEAIQKERDERSKMEFPIPAEYLHIDVIADYPNQLKMTGQVLTHNREKSLRWFTDRLKQLVEDRKTA